MFNTCQIVYHHQNCLNTKRPYAKPCRLCIDACPHQAISVDREIDSKRCTECGVCMAVCPSDGFLDRNSDRLHRFIEISDNITLNCPQAAPVGFEIPCLGVIDRDLWTTLMLAAKGKEVKLHTGKCSECPDKKACAQSVRAFKEVHADWAEHPPVRIQVSPYEGEELPQATTTPKVETSEKGSWKEKGWEKIESLLPGLTSDEAYDIPRTRQLLTKHMETNPEEKVPIPALRANDQCTSCGVCAAICPQGALTKKENGDEFSLVYEPYKCVRCQRCVGVCRPEALSFGTKPLTHRFLKGKILLHKGSPRHCSRCGRQVFDWSEPPMCVACAASDSDGGGFFR
jgi:energy-converting hydrogenase B subunit K